MRYEDLDFIAPRAADAPAGVNEAEVFGSAVWLWMHSTSHRNAPLHMLSALLLPAIKSRQFVLASHGGKPVFYMSWARMSADAEARYVSNPPECMPAEDWTSGERNWILDWVAPFGHTRQIKRLLSQTLLRNQSAKSLNHRGSQTGLRIMTFSRRTVPATENPAGTLTISSSGNNTGEQQ